VRHPRPGDRRRPPHPGGRARRDRGPPHRGVRLSDAPQDAVAHDAVARAFRDGYGRAVALLARALGDIDRAEDALQDAAAVALERWPRDGVPRNPAAWLVTAARNRAIDRIRAERTRSRSEEARARTVQEAAIDITLTGDPPVPDERLALIFACCHPALAIEARVTLTLRLVAGLTVPEVARALLMEPAAVAQRLVRAKRKIRDAAIPIAEPPREQLPERIDGVLTVLYLVYTEGHTATGGGSLRRDDVAEEAIRLAEVLHRLMPDEAEPAALLALMLLHHARREGRTGPDGELVLLADQDRSRWDRAAIARGAALVERALRMRRPPGRYAVEAAIAAVHAEAPTAAETDWPQILGLYDVLRSVAPSPVADLNRAVALAEVEGPAAGLAEVEEVAADGRLDGYAPLHAARADMLRRLGRGGEAAAAYARAAELSVNPAERAFLAGRAQAEAGGPD
jgi:RNA polymerase sigma-70 factor (ECF subfamily)